MLVHHPKIVLLGKDGQLGWELQRSLSSLGELVSMGRQEADMVDLKGLRRQIKALRPDVIVNASAYTAVDKAEREPDQAFLINSESVAVLAQEAQELGACLVHYSTDYVFDGLKATAYLEDDMAEPLSVYGRSKLAGEQAVRASGCRHLIFRSSWVYSVHGANFPLAILRRALEREEIDVVVDSFGAPTSAGLMADVTALAVYKVLGADRSGQNHPQGTYHLVASGQTSWYEYAKFLLRAARNKGLPVKVAPNRIFPISGDSLKSAAKRPKNSCLATDKIANDFQLVLPDWKSHVLRFVDELIASKRL